MSKVKQVKGLADSRFNLVQLLPFFGCEGRAFIIVGA